MMFSKRIPKALLNELQALNSLIKAEKFKRDQVKANTALVHKGQQYVETINGVITVLENAQANLVAKAVSGLGFPQGKPLEVDLNNGKVWTKN